MVEYNVQTMFQKIFRDVYFIQAKMVFILAFHEHNASYYLKVKLSNSSLFSLNLCFIFAKYLCPLPQ